MQAKLQAIAGPVRLIYREQMAKVRRRAMEPALQAAKRFLLAEPVWNGHDQGL